MRVDREERIEHANVCRIKMADALASAWQKGERLLVKKTIEGGLDAIMRRQWEDDTASALPIEQRDKFLEFLRS